MGSYSTPSEGVRGNDKGKTALQRPWRHRDNSTPSEGVGKTAECLLLPKEFWDAVRAERRYSVYNGGRQISLLPKEWAKWGHTLLLPKE